jgi:hypothetical protein
MSRIPDGIRELTCDGDRVRIDTQEGGVELDPEKTRWLANQLHGHADLAEKRGQYEYDPDDAGDEFEHSIATHHVLHEGELEELRSGEEVVVHRDIGDTEITLTLHYGPELEY